MLNRLQAIKNCIETVFLNVLELFLEVLLLVLWPIKFLGFKAHMFVFIIDGLFFIYQHYINLKYGSLISLLILVVFPILVCFLKCVRKRISKRCSEISNYLMFPLSRADIYKRRALKRMEGDLKKQMKKESYKNK